MPAFGHKEGAFWFYWSLVVAGLFVLITYRKDPVSMSAGAAAMLIGSVMLILPPLLRGGWPIARFAILAGSIVAAVTCFVAYWKDRNSYLVVSLGLGAVILLASYLLSSPRLFGRWMIDRKLTAESAGGSHTATSIGPWLTLDINAFTHHLSHLTHSTERLLTAGFTRKEFAVLNVTNHGAKNLHRIVARCQFSRYVEDFCIWSAKTGSVFEPGGSHEADISAGNSRLLVVAQGFDAYKLWARLPQAGEPFYEAFEICGVSREGQTVEESVNICSQSGVVLTLAGREVPVSVSFQAKGLYQLERFRLGFDAGKPAITTRASDPLAIRDHLASLPLLQREDEECLYRGTEAIWGGELHSLARNADGGITLYVRFAPGQVSRNCFRADCRETTVIKSLKKGNYIKVKGTIEFVGENPWLNPAEVLF